MTTNEWDPLELCRIDSAITAITVWISERLASKKEEMVAVDNVWTAFIC